MGNGRQRHARIRSGKCPACQNMIEGAPALSRYAHERFICSRCGTREALQGFFWMEYARRKRIRLKDHHAETFGFGAARGKINYEKVKPDRRRKESRPPKTEAATQEGGPDRPADRVTGPRGDGEDH